MVTAVPATVIVACRELLVVFGSTTYGTLHVPVPDRRMIVSQEASLVAVQGQSPCVVTPMVRSPPHDVSDLLVYCTV